MGYFEVKYDSRVVNYDRKLFIRLVTGHTVDPFLSKEGLLRTPY